MAYAQLEIYAQSLEMNTSISILIPEDIKPKEKIKSLYLLHGYRGNHFDWMQNTAIGRYVKDERIAVIMPEVNNAFYTDMAKGFDYFTYVAKELPMIMENLFPLSRKREDRFVAGLSMGGYGAFKIAALRPNAFSKAVSLSGALDIKSIFNMTKERDPKDYFFAVFGSKMRDVEKNDLYVIFNRLLKKKIHPKLYMACGTEDFLFQDNEKFYDFLVENGFECYYESQTGEHTWDFWDRYIEKAIQWLLES